MTLFSTNVEAVTGEFRIVAWEPESSRSDAVADSVIEPVFESALSEIPFPAAATEPEFVTRLSLTEDSAVTSELIMDAKALGFPLSDPSSVAVAVIEIAPVLEDALNTIPSEPAMMAPEFDTTLPTTAAAELTPELVMSVFAGPFPESVVIALRISSPVEEFACKEMPFPAA
jgi:hypothetical protein